MYSESSDSARAAALCWVWCDVLASRDATVLIGRIVWESRFDPSLWDVGMMARAAKRAYCIIFEEEFKQKRTQEEARQRGQEVPYYLIRYLVTKKNRRSESSQERI